MVIFAVAPEDTEKAKALAQEFSLNYSTETPQDYYLTFENDRLVVKDPRQGAHFSISIDIENEMKVLKKQKISVKKDLLARAVGYKGDEGYTVFDATLGMGKDSIHLLQLGCHVIACEKDPVIFALMRDALLRARDSLNFQLFHGESSEIIQMSECKIDCLYLDPMFEDVSKKSAPKKGMAFLRARNLISYRIDEIFHSAQAKNIKRIVVKRPLKGQQLYSEPQMSLNGKLVRYDIYIR